MLFATNTLRIGIMNKIPSSPPANAISVVVQKSKSCHAPMSTIAGIVKMIPAASDSPADAAVWTWFASRIVPFRKSPRRISIPTTAAGIDADTVIPALSPRYTFAAAITTESTRPMTTARTLSSRTWATGIAMARSRTPPETAWQAA